MPRAEFSTDPSQMPHAASAETAVTSGLLISLPLLTPESLRASLENIQAAFLDTSVTVVTPVTEPDAAVNWPSLRVVHVVPAATSATPWVLSAADYLTVFESARQNSARGCVILGSEAQSLQPEVIRALADGLEAGTDLVTPHYDLKAREGLVNSSILYPVSRALYGARARFPLSIDLAVSARMLERLATAAQRFTAVGQNDALIWPVAEAAVAGFSVAEVPANHRTFQQPGSDLNTVLAQIAGSLFSDIESKAAFWQRARANQTHIPAATHESAETVPDVSPMIESFRLAYTNLREIWSLVLPPQSLLGLKKLSLLPPESFRMPDSLWARTVYDFVLAYRLRTLNRGHLLGALTPLYLAWVASHLLLTSAGTPAERHIEECVAAFEADKPYFVSRWRWPDRFNP